MTLARSPRCILQLGVGRLAASEIARVKCWFSEVTGVVACFRGQISRGHSGFLAFYGLPGVDKDKDRCGKSEAYCSGNACSNEGCATFLKTTWPPVGGLNRSGHLCKKTTSTLSLRTNF